MYLTMMPRDNTSLFSLSRPTSVSRGFALTATLAPQKSENAVTWDLQITNDNPQCGLWHVVFPQIAVKDLGEGGRVFVPVTAGIELANLWSKADKKGGTYPSGWTCMQYVAAYNKAGTGLYVGMHDPFGSTKDISAEGQPAKHAVVLCFDHPVPNMGKAGTGFELSGQARWQLLRGDWFDAAHDLPRLGRPKCEWYPTLGPEGRADTPQWMRELPAWAMTGGSASRVRAQGEGFRTRRSACRSAFTGTTGTRFPSTTTIPITSRPRRDSPRGSRELKAAGVYVMPYINGRLWDTHDKGPEDFEFTRVALPAATKDEAGKPYIESYGSKETDGNNVKLAVMCPVDRPVAKPGPRHRAAAVQRVRRQRRVHRPDRRRRAAFVLRSPRTAIPLGGGHWWTEGYWAMLERHPHRQARRAACSPPSATPSHTSSGSMAI